MVDTTSAYLPCMSNRLTLCDTISRSKQHSSTTDTAKLFEKASMTVPRTQPLVVVPVTSTLSQPMATR